MKGLIDTNIFVYASYEKNSRFAAARNFLKSCVEKSSSWYVSWGIIYEYLRVATHPFAFPEQTLSLEQALENVLQFIQTASAEILVETDQHFSILKKISAESHGLKGSILHDTHLVALMQEHEIDTIYSSDSDFHKFKGIKIINPLK